MKPQPSSRVASNEESPAKSCVRERPIIFSGVMVRALLAGTKTRRKLYAPSGTDPGSPEHLTRRLANGLADVPDDGCWNWMRTVNNHGYATLRLAGHTVYAHRLAYELAIGPIPAGLHVLHSCDNPRCINPAHLKPGTRSQNMKECSERGRARIPTPVLRGEANGASKLTTEEVGDIVRMLASGFTQEACASRYGVSQSQISNIKRGKAWAVLS